MCSYSSNIQQRRLKCMIIWRSWTGKARLIANWLCTKSKVHLIRPSNHRSTPAVERPICRENTSSVTIVASDDDVWSACQLRHVRHDSILIVQTIIRLAWIKHGILKSANSEVWQMNLTMCNMMPIMLYALCQLIHSKQFRSKPGSEYLLVVGASCMRHTLDATMGLRRSKRSSIERNVCIQ